MLIGDEEAEAVARVLFIEEVDHLDDGGDFIRIERFLAALILEEEEEVGIVSSRRCLSRTDLFKKAVEHPEGPRDLEHKRV